jgi:hypothetical protein
MNRPGKHMASSKRSIRRRRERLMPLADASQVVDDGILFDQLSLLKNHGFTQDELRTMSPADVSRQYALALREGATVGPPPAEAAELAETGATPVSGVWPQPTNPLFQIDGPVARLLKGLLPSPRDRDELPLTDALGAIEFFVSSYRKPARKTAHLLHHDSSLRRPQHLHAKRKELDKISEKAIELATDIRGCEVLGHYIHFEALLGALDDFAEFVAAERKRLVGKRGPKTPRPFVEEIIRIIEEHTGTKLKRSNKWGPPAVVVRIVEIVDPAIGSGTIDEALRAQSRAGRKISRQKRGEIKRQKR